MMLIPSEVFRVRFGARPDRGAVNVPGSGLIFAGSVTVAVPAANDTVFGQTVLLNKPTAGSVLNQKAGDTLTMIFARDGSDAADTCTDVLEAVGATVVYKTN